MTLKEQLNHKEKVHGLCLKMVKDRVDICQLAMDNAQQASNDEEKSSAGDKFETSRAMNHMEKEMYGKQLQSNLMEQAAIQAISLNGRHDAIQSGSYISCRDFDFYIAGGLGKTEVNGRLIYLLSPDAPLAALLRSKKKGDTFLFNKHEIRIADVY